ncbi:ATP-binding protein [Lentzea sp. NEAU-D7]|uniref:ATP-binding protein n=1 Tax=Lentzea sp. NEAU-D7 TaxID=2994667 RepID=UPI00224A96D1|nr:ATP-binding protein [Lentzea sp. NEAU-D7]MCX2948907.1 ATP-binding protein [Lentzea sp. NEAU-D7]
MTVGDGPAAIVLDLPVEPNIKLSVVRDQVAVTLRDLGEDHRYDVALVVTELVSNVLDHTPGTGRLRIFRYYAPCDIKIEVDDSSPAQPVRGRSRLGGTRGRGIVVVDNLACEWGSRPLPDGGKTVFASIPCPDDENSTSP